MTTEDASVSEPVDPEVQVSDATALAVPDADEPDAPEDEDEPVMPDIFVKWQTEWKPHPKYLTLAQVQEKIGDRDLAEVLSQCQCIGYTIHVEREIPAEAWTTEGWAWDVEKNRCGRTMYAEHLQFQVEVFERDVDAVIDGRDPRAPEPDAPRVPERLEVEELDGFQGLPAGWAMRTAGGVVWQAYNADGDLYGPMRVDMALAVGDAWSFQAASKWA